METEIRHLLDEGRTLFKNQLYKKAEAVFLKVLVRKNEFADVYNMLGVINHQQGQFNKAITYLQRALKINPNYTEAKLNLSVLYNDLGEYKLSKTLVDKENKANDKNRSGLPALYRAKLANKHAEMGDLYQGLGLVADAILEYEKALEFSPQFYDIAIKMGVCLRETGKVAQALKVFQQIIKSSPRFADAKIQLGITYYISGKVNEARRIWSAVDIKKNPLAEMYLRLSSIKVSPKAK